MEVIISLLKMLKKDILRFLMNMTRQDHMNLLQHRLRVLLRDKPVSIWVHIPKYTLMRHLHYWYSKLEFNTEAGPTGEQIPPIETMRMMMPEKDLWPMSTSWDIRLHKAFYPMQELPSNQGMENQRVLKNIV